MDHFDNIAAQRRSLSDILETLTPEQWGEESLCSDWSVREVAAHLIWPFELKKRAMLIGLLKHRFDFNAFSLAEAKRIGQRPTSELVAALRSNADHRFTPPGLDSVAPLADAVVHGQDIVRPLGIELLPDADCVVPVLEATHGGIFKRIVPPSRFEGLSFRATDADWSAGSGPEVTGGAVAIATAMWGRPEAASALEGAGSDTFRGRLH